MLSVDIDPESVPGRPFDEPIGKREDVGVIEVLQTDTGGRLMKVESMAGRLRRGVLLRDDDLLEALVAFHALERGTDLVE